jgi:RND superfamily putative drug exporter
VEHHHRWLVLALSVLALVGGVGLVATQGIATAGGLFTSLALGAILVVLVAVVASATTLPALLAVLGDRVDALRLPFTARRRARAGSATCSCRPR